MITPLHTFPSLFISWVCVCVCVTCSSVLCPPVPCSSTAPLLACASAPGFLHPWGTGRVSKLNSLCNRGQFTERVGRLTLSHFGLDNMHVDIKSESLSAYLSSCCSPGERVLLKYSSISCTGLYFIFQFSLTEERNALQASSGTNHWVQIILNMFLLFVFAHIWWHIILNRFVSTYFTMVY